MLRASIRERFARRLLDRWGVLFRDVVARETLAPRWLPVAIDAIRASRRSGDDAALTEVSAYDPLHLTGIILPSRTGDDLSKRVPVLA